MRAPNWNLSLGGLALLTGSLALAGTLAIYGGERVATPPPGQTPLPAQTPPRSTELTWQDRATAAQLRVRTPLAPALEISGSAERRIVFSAPRPASTAEESSRRPGEGEREIREVPTSSQQPPAVFNPRPRAAGGEGGRRPGEGDRGTRDIPPSSQPPAIHPTPASQPTASLAPSLPTARTTLRIASSSKDCFGADPASTASGWPPTSRVVPPLLSPLEPVNQRAAIPLVCLPGEFEPQAALVLGCGELAEFYPRLLATVVRHARHEVAIVALVPSADSARLVEQTLQTYGLPRSSVQMIEVPHNTMWTRDYGPILVRQANGSGALVDASYAGSTRDRDDLVPRALGGRFGLPVFNVPLSIEGGNLLSNGAGLCVATKMILARNEPRGYDERDVRRLLSQFFGARQCLLLEPLQGEPTGHVDMFATFTDPQTIVVGQYDPAIDPTNAAILDRNAAALAKLVIGDEPLRVVRMPMPSNADRKWRTYTNAVFINGLLLVPTYGDWDHSGERAACDLYRRLLPEWRIVTIDSSDVIRMGGALHCMSLNLARVWPRLALPEPGE